MNLSGGEEPARVEAGGVTANFFATLGVSPALGRAFLADDARPGAPDVVLLSDGLWRRRFGAGPAVVGRDLMLNGQPTTVAGVMPAGFQVPPGGELWVPFTEGGSGGPRGGQRRGGLGCGGRPPPAGS